MTFISSPLPRAVLGASRATVLSHTPRAMPAAKLRFVRNFEPIRACWRITKPHCPLNGSTDRQSVRGTWQVARGTSHVARRTWHVARDVARRTWHVARRTWHVARGTCHTAPSMSRVLVVEDDPDIADLIRHYLEKGGHTVETLA